MPRRTVEPHRSLHRSSFQLGNVQKNNDLTWETEYDSEFAGEKTSSQAADGSMQQQSSFHPSPRWPASFKKHYVHMQDYSRLEQQYLDAKANEMLLDQQLTELEHMMDSWRESDRSLKASIQQEHDTVQRLYTQFRDMAESLGSLLGTIDTSRSMMLPPEAAGEQMPADDYLGPAPLPYAHKGSTAGAGFGGSAQPSPTRTVAPHTRSPPSSPMHPQQQRLRSARPPPVQVDGPNVIFMDSPRTPGVPTSSRGMANRLDDIEQHMQRLGAAVQHLLGAVQERRGRIRPGMLALGSHEAAAAATQAAGIMQGRGYGQGQASPRLRPHSAFAASPTRQAQRSPLMRYKLKQPDEPIERYPKDLTYGHLGNAGQRGHWVP